LVNACLVEQKNILLCLGFLLLTLSVFALFLIQDVNGVNPSGGRNIIRVPLEWCAVSGSPVASLSSNDMDMTLWKRHERATDYIYNPQAQITFRSAIDLVMSFGGNLHFPTVNGPRASGDINARDTNEINALIHDCRQMWVNQGSRGFGITAINVNHFITSGGAVDTIAGTSNCVKFSSPMVPCGRTQNGVTIYDGYIVVIDNQYTYTRNGQLLDPYDQLVGHELGHALGLWCGSANCPLPDYGLDPNSPMHRTGDPGALMAPTPRIGSGIVDNVNVNNIVNNINLRSDEQDFVRSSAMNIPGNQQDPPTAVINGDILGTYLIDRAQEVAPSYLDISMVSAALDKAANETAFGHQLFGSIPDFVKGLQYWTLIDTDNDKSTGAKPSLLETIGVPNTEFTGSEVIARLNVSNRHIEGEVWKFEDNKLVQLPANAFRVQLLSQNLIGDPSPSFNSSFVSPLYDIPSFSLDNRYANIAVSKPFKVQALTAQQPQGQPLVLVDRLDESPGEAGTGSSFENPAFPQCFPSGNATPGGTVKIELVGLLANTAMHGILGAKEVFEGVTNSTGGAIIDFPIPTNTSSGLHLVTIGSDNTALTADCAIDVIGTHKTKQVLNGMPDNGPFTNVTVYPDLKK
jgi:hypothetical protein